MPPGSPGPAAFGSRFSNELILARVDDRRTCLPNSGFPTVIACGPTRAMLLAGVAGNCLGLETGHTLWELTDNFGMAAGSHRLTFGIHGELIDLVDDAVRSPTGFWFFDSLDSLEQGEASCYIRDLPVAGATGGVPREPDQRLPAGSMAADAAPDIDSRSPPRRAVRPHAAHAESGGR